LSGKMSIGACMAATDTPAQVVVCDAGPLIHLDELGCLELLSDFGRVLSPPSVCEEVSRHRPSALNHQQVRVERLSVEVPPTADLRGMQRLFALHQAELDALCLVRQTKAGMFLTDDTAARLAAQQLAISVHGTIGVVVRAIRRSLKSRDEVVNTLRSLPTASTLHVRPSFLEEIIAEVERGS